MAHEARFSVAGRLINLASLLTQFQSIVLQTEPDLGSVFAGVCRRTGATPERSWRLPPLLPLADCMSKQGGIQGGTVHCTLVLLLT